MLANRFVPIALALALAGCGSVGAIGPFGGKTLTPPAPVDTAGLPATTDPGPTSTTATTDTVASEPLPAPADDQSTVASSAPASGPVKAAGALGRTDLLGGWTITASGDSCQLFMTLTSWTGGYRASTRGCNNDMLKSISAWNLEGKQVVLAGSGGTPVARLQSSGNNRFDGTAEGQSTPVTFFR